MGFSCNEVSLVTEGHYWSLNGTNGDSFNVFKVEFVCWEITTDIMDIFISASVFGGRDLIMD